MVTKKQSRPIVQGLANPRGVTAVYGTPIDWGSLPEKIRIGRRIANGRFKLEAHYPAKHFNDKKEYIEKRKAGSYCRFYDKKSPFFIARTVWDGTSQPGMHMVVKNRNETYSFLLTPKANAPTEATVIGAYLVHREDGVPVLCSGPIGELKAVGDDGDFKVTAYKKHGIRCPKKDSSGKDLAGEIPQTFGYTKRTSKKGPRKTAKDYCKPSHTFKHPTDVKRAEVVEEMDAYMDEQCTCLMCNWSGAYMDLTFLDDTAEGGPPGMDFMLVCPSCGVGVWLDVMMAEGYDDPCFSCDGIGTWDDGDCEYCEGSGMMSDTLRAEMALYNSEYFDADCGCFKKAEETLVWKDKTLSFMDWAKQEEASHLKKYGAEYFEAPRNCSCNLTRDSLVWLDYDKHRNTVSSPLWFLDKTIQDYDDEGLLHSDYQVRCDRCGRYIDQTTGVLDLAAEEPESLSSGGGAIQSMAAKDFLFMVYDVRDGDYEYTHYAILPKAYEGRSDKELIEWMYGDVGDKWGDDYWVHGEMLVSVRNKAPITEDLKATFNSLGLYADTFEAKYTSADTPADPEKIVVLFDVSGSGGSRERLGRGPDTHISNPAFAKGRNWIWYCESEILDDIQKIWDERGVPIDFISFGNHAKNVSAPVGPHTGWNVQGVEGGTFPERGLALMEDNFEKEFGTDRPATRLYIISDGAFNYPNLIPYLEKPWIEEARIIFIEGVEGQMTGSKKAMEKALAANKLEAKVQVSTEIPRVPTGSMTKSFSAPYAGPGATMDIGKDTALSSFTPEELTTSSAIHGDFDQASLDYSGHQNIEVRAESLEAEEKCGNCGMTDPIALAYFCDKCNGCEGCCECKEAEDESRPIPKWANPHG